MAKVNRFARTRIASTINARYHPDEVVIDSYFLDGRFPTRRESRAVDMTTVKEERGFFYGIFAHPKEEHKATGEMPFARALERLNNEVRSGVKNIDEQINDLADVAVDVTGRATLNRNGVRQSWFSGILIKEGEIAAVTTTSGCALLYRGDVLYPLTESDFDLEGIDYNGNPVDGINDYAAGVAGTIRYSNIAQLKPNDCIILCNKELLEALGQREMLRLLFAAEDQMEAAQQIMTAAAAKAPTISLQLLLAFVEDVNLQSKTGRLNLGLFNTGSTPSPQELHRGDGHRNPTHKVEDNRNHMKRNNDYPDRQGHDQRYNTGAWQDEQHLKSDDAFAPAGGQTDAYEDFVADNAYDGGHDDPYRRDYQEPERHYTNEYQPQDYSDDYYDSCDTGHDVNDTYDDGYDNYNDSYNHYDEYDQDYDAYDDHGGAGGYDDGYHDGDYDDGYGYSDHYDDDYYDDYYDDDGYEKREKMKRIIIMALVGLLLLLAVFFLIRKFTSGGKEKETTETTVEETSKEEESSSQPALVQPIQSTAAQTQPTPSESNNEQDLFELTFMTDNGETPRQFITSIYGKDDEIYYQFLKRLNPRIPDMDTPMEGGLYLKVPVAENGPFKILDSWLNDPVVKAGYDEGVRKIREQQQQQPQPSPTPSATDFEQDTQTSDTGNQG